MTFRFVKNVVRLLVQFLYSTVTFVLVSVISCVCAGAAIASLRDINEDRLCYDESLLRDDWLWTGTQYPHYHNLSHLSHLSHLPARCITYSLCL